MGGSNHSVVELLLLPILGKTIRDKYLGRTISELMYIAYFAEVHFLKNIVFL